ncbi:MAG TPA: DUF882 domain-containing protein [Patescibacteria group bacterium]|nr:DUF882 domain-containing protein [Patescibacteria group bacterium]
MNRFIDPAELMAKNSSAADAFDADRRSFLKLGATAAVALGCWMPDLSLASTGPTLKNAGREIQITNVHTGEKFRGEYWMGGRYLPDAFGEIKSVMRDHRSGEKFPIDPRLMDILYVLQHRLGNLNMIDVFSGYRSPTTNARLRSASHGVAQRSLHMSGQAIDIKLPGTQLKNLRAAAIKLNSGGVGYYPASNFVHVDTGRVRHW